VLTHWEVPQESLQAQVIQRRREELTRIRDSGDPKFSACTDFEPKPLNLTELSNPCALQFLDNNYGTVQAEDCGPSPTLLLLLLPLAVLPRRWDSGRPEALRDAATSSLIIGGMAGAVYLGAAWTSYSEKYILAFVPILVSLVPVACARLGATAGHLISQPTNGARLGLAGAVVLAATVWPKPTGLHADAPRITPGWEQLSGAAARWAQETLGPDDLLLDCVPLRVDLAMLPHAVPSRFGIGTQMPCSGWIEDPPEAQGTVYMLTRAYPELVHTQPERIAAKGWRRVLRLDQSHSLWQRIASSDRSE
jgi:hypothetical protein